MVLITWEKLQSIVSYHKWWRYIYKTSHMQILVQFVLDAMLNIILIAIVFLMPYLIPTKGQSYLLITNFISMTTRMENPILYVSPRRYNLRNRMWIYCTHFRQYQEGLNHTIDPCNLMKTHHSLLYFPTELHIYLSW